MPVRRCEPWCCACRRRPATHDALCGFCAQLERMGYRLERSELEPLSRQEFHRRLYEWLEEAA